MSEQTPTDLVVATITITRTLDPDDLLDTVTAEDHNGDQLPLAEALGMLRLAEDTLIRSRLDPDPEDDDEDEADE